MASAWPASQKQRLRRLVALNVGELVHNLAKINSIQHAMRGEYPSRLHGLVYDVADGGLKDLEVTTSFGSGLQYIYVTAAPTDGEAAAVPAPGA